MLSVLPGLDAGVLGSIIDACLCQQTVKVVG